MPETSAGDLDTWAVALLVAEEERNARWPARRGSDAVDGGAIFQSVPKVSAVATDRVVAYRAAPAPLWTSLSKASLRVRGIQRTETAMRKKRESGEGGVAIESDEVVHVEVREEYGANPL